MSASVIRRIRRKARLDFHRKYLIIVVVYGDKMTQKCNVPIQMRDYMT